MLNITTSSVEELAKKDPKIQEMYERSKRIPELKLEIQNKINY